MNRFVERNRELWNEWADINFRSGFYDVEGFKTAPPPLDREVLEGLGDLTGKSLLHLQCHFGMDTLRLARLAKAVTGVDFSDKAIAYARQLSSETGIAATFVQSDVYELPNVLDGKFDAVFTSYGVIGWLPDLERWAQIIARYLEPGGSFFIIEGHPTMWMFDSEATELRVKYPYFRSDEPIVIEPTVGNYADPTATVTKTEYSWPHDLSEIVTSLVRAGLRIDELREYPHVVWKAFPFLVEEAPDRWVMPPDRPSFPLMFSIRATRA